MKILHKIKTADCEIYVVLNLFFKKWYTFIALNCFFSQNTCSKLIVIKMIYPRKFFFCFKLRLTKCIHWSMAQLFQQLRGTLELQEILI